MVKFSPNKIIIHCSDSEWGNVNVIRDWHLQRGFNDIGYHFIILNGKVSHSNNPFRMSLNGSIEIGRDLNIKGSHCKGHNHDSIGICLIGVELFTDEQYNSLVFLIDDLCEEYSINASEIYGHRDFNSKKTCPNFDVKKFVEDEYNPITF